MVSEPTGNVEVVMDTDPLVIVPEPRFVEPFVKLIVPVAPDGTVAVIVTVWPYVLDDGLAVTVIVGVPLPTVSVAVPVAELLFESPA